MPRCVIRTILSIGLLLAVLGVPCGADASPVPRPPVLAWSFDIHGDHDGDPHGRVFLRVNGSSVLILPETDMAYHLVQRSEYRAIGVPAAALTACSDWWAGAGMDLYVVRRRGRLNVFLRDLDEQAPASAYRLIKSIPLRRR